jgi:CRP-like cAMP-binding protein
MKPRFFAKGDVIFHDGESAENAPFYYIEQGSVELYVETYKGSLEKTVLA